MISSHTHTPQKKNPLKKSVINLLSKMKTSNEQFEWINGRKDGRNCVVVWCLWCLRRTRSGGIIRGDCNNQRDNSTNNEHQKAIRTYVGVIQNYKTNIAHKYSVYVQGTLYDSYEFRSRFSPKNMLLHRGANKTNIVGLWVCIGLVEILP